MRFCVARGACPCGGLGFGPSGPAGLPGQLVVVAGGGYRRASPAILVPRAREEEAEVPQTVLCLRGSSVPRVLMWC